MIDDAFVHGYTSFVRDILERQIEHLDVRGYCYDGYVAEIHDMKSYFEENMKLLEEEKVKYVFGYPGVAICPFYNSILDSSIETILVTITRHATSTVPRPRT
jgi:hypothetical protein